MGTSQTVVTTWRRVGRRQWLLTAAIFLSCSCDHQENVALADGGDEGVIPWLSVNGNEIVNSRGVPIELRGINLFVGSFRGDVEPGVINEGDVAQTRFLDGMLAHTVTETDFVDLRAMGMNSARLGLITYKDFENDEAPLTYREQNFEALDSLIEGAERQQVYLILSMRQSPGGHNTADHSGSRNCDDSPVEEPTGCDETAPETTPGCRELWRNAEYQERLVKLWEKIAARYHDRPIIAGYDVLNEPDAPNATALNDLYGRLIAGIRLHDERHIIFLEGERWATKLQCVFSPQDVNVALSAHFYDPAWYTHDQDPAGDHGYPSEEDGFTRDTLREALSDRVASSLDLPVWVGEFGAQTSVPTYLAYSRDVRDLLEEMGLHSSYYDYKNLRGHAGAWSIYHMRADNEFRRFIDDLVAGVKPFEDYTEQELVDILLSLETSNFLRKDELWEMLAHADGDK